jgi:hypothetical protein
MKGIPGTLLALIFVFFSLLSMLTANRTWEKSLVPVGDNESRISELGLRFALQR